MAFRVNLFRQSSRFAAPFRLATWLGSLSASIICLATSLLAQEPVKKTVQPVTRRAVDQLLLKTGTRLSGMFGGEVENGDWIFFVNRAWLRENQPIYCKRIEAQELSQTKGILETLRERIVAWRKARDEPRVLTLLLERNLEDAEARLKTANEPPETPSEIIGLQIPQDDIKNKFQQPPEVRKLLGLAWEYHLTDAEERTRTELKKALEGLKVNIEKSSPDLSDRLGLMPQDNRQWAARVALIEYEILGKPHFQGQGSVLARTDGDSPPVAAAGLVGGLAQDQLGDLLGELLTPGNAASQQAEKEKKFQAAIDKATKEAEGEGWNAVRITRLEPAPAQSRLTVTGLFLARMQDGTWREVWRESRVADTSKPRPEAEQEIAKDPQVAAAIESVKKLGGLVDEGTIALAIRVGAAAKEAQDAVAASFSDYSRRHTRRLDTPPVWLPPEPTAP